MNLLPAILIGGPPHSGKSVLAYSLTQALRARNVGHYLLRAAPDGEGDWSQQIASHPLNAIRFKGRWTQHWVDVVCRDIAARPMPLLVDVGGKPTDEQLSIFDQCTGAVLLTPNEDAADHWCDLVQSRGLPVIADLRSELDGTNALIQTTAQGSIRGTLTGLTRGEGQASTGPAFEALVERVAGMFDLPARHAREAHLASAPADTHLVDFEGIAQTLYPDDPLHRLKADDLNHMLHLVPVHVPVAVYGRTVSWLAVALGATRDVTWMFSASQGWVPVPRFVMATAHSDAWHANESLAMTVASRGDGVTVLSTQRPNYYLDYAVMHGMQAPHLPRSARVLISGPLPMWAFAAFGRVYRPCAAVMGDHPQSRSR